MLKIQKVPVLILQYPVHHVTSPFHTAHSWRVYCANILYKTYYTGVGGHFCHFFKLPQEVVSGAGSFYPGSCAKDPSQHQVLSVKWCKVFHEVLLCCFSWETLPTYTGRETAFTTSFYLPGYVKVLKQVLKYL